MSHASESSASPCLRARSSVPTRRKARFLSALAALTLVGGALLTGCGGSGNGSSNQGGQLPAAGKGVVSATFSAASGTNADTSAFQSTIAQALTSTGASGFTLLNVTGIITAGSTSRSLLISLADNGPIQAGKTYTFSNTGINSVSTLTYLQAGAGGAPGWLASGGSAVVDSITGKNYKLHLTNVTFTTIADNNSGATGSFTVNGTADVTLP